MGEAVLAVGAPEETVSPGESFFLRMQSSLPTTPGGAGGSSSSSSSAIPASSVYVVATVPPRWEAGVWWVTLPAVASPPPTFSLALAAAPGDSLSTAAAPNGTLVSRPLPASTTADYLAAVIAEDLLKPWGRDGWDGRPCRVTVQELLPPLGHSLQLSLPQHQPTGRAFRVSLDNANFPGPQLRAGEGCAVHLSRAPTYLGGTFRVSSGFQRGPDVGAVRQAQQAGVHLQPLLSRLSLPPLTSTPGDVPSTASLLASPTLAALFTGGVRTSRALPFNATAEAVAGALRSDLSLPFVTVKRVCLDAPQRANSGDVLTTSSVAVQQGLEAEGSVGGGGASPGQLRLVY